MRRLRELLRVAPGARPALRDAEAGRHFGWHEAAAQADTAELKTRLNLLQHRLIVDGRFGLLIVLQAIDGGGKDSTVHHVISAFNPQGCTVTSFKTPSLEEARHDFLWRVHARVPARGEIGVFNRSHYEEVLIARVDALVERPVWRARYAQINEFEAMLGAAGITVLKFFLHISRAEQRRRFEERLHDRAKNWKLEVDDLRKRRQWQAYRHAFQDMIERCGTRAAPWYVVPANHKWLRNLAVAQIIADTLEALPLRLPPPRFDPKRLRIR
jgi:PPK2 family polyphosphate:nucleotide phosphotransferase